MKLSHLYSDQPTLFSPIRFREGFNVIIANIRHSKEDGKIGHNLGKTLLIDIIDFCLLKSVTKGHLFKAKSDLFADFVFFLEIQLPSGGFLSIRRSAGETTKIAFKRHQQPYQDFTALPEVEWDHWRETFDNAVAMLDSLLNFSSIKPWSYRKGISYFLRSQDDYGDVFRLSKYMVGKHREWKPYLARVLGFDDQLLLSKYDADAELKKCNERRAELQAEVTLKPSDYEKLRAGIAVKRDEVDTKVRALDVFDFHGQEVQLVKEAADSIEAEIAGNNEALYNARHDLAQIERGLSDKIDFDLADVQRVFEEAKLTFPQQLARDYNDLVEFNKRILRERHASLKERAEVLRVEIGGLERTNASLGDKRRDILRVLGGTDSLQKFKDLQRQLDQDRAHLEGLEVKAEKLRGIRELLELQRRTKAHVEQLTGEIEQMIERDNPRFVGIGLTFSHIVKDVLSRTALLYLKANSEGNLDPYAEFSDADSDIHTEEDKGTSFRQMLCIAFDLAVLISYARESFFHFVYHDGGLERLQNKLKLALLRVIRESCDKHGIQYILTALSEDLPIAEDTSGLCPQPDEIVLTLDDSGDKGRLFKMGTF